MSDLDLGPDSPVFDALLELCPWARPHWADRRDLIAARRWNVNHINQGGNDATSAWLTSFFPARARATLDLLTGPPDVYTRWAYEIHGVARACFVHPDLAAATPGTPMIPDKWGASLDWSEVVEGYAPGQFLADMLLLMQSSLRGAIVDVPLDICGKVFPVGLETAGEFAAGFAARNARFGPFSAFQATYRGDVDFEGATFLGVAPFSVQTFPGRANFSGAHFDGPVTFDATRFRGETSLNAATFASSAQFNGTVFETSPDFSGADFGGEVTFGDAMFLASANFDGAKFNSSVYFETLPAGIRNLIEVADHGAGGPKHGQPIY